MGTLYDEGYRTWNLVSLVASYNFASYFVFARWMPQEACLIFLMSYRISASLLALTHPLCIGLHDCIIPALILAYILVHAFTTNL